MVVESKGDTHVSVLWAKSDAAEHMERIPTSMGERFDPDDADDRLITLAKPCDQSDIEWFQRVSGRAMGELVTLRHWIWVVTELDLGGWWLYLSALFPGGDVDVPIPWVPEGPTRWWVVTLEEPGVWVAGPYDHRPWPADYPPDDR